MDFKEIGLNDEQIEKVQSHINSINDSHTIALDSVKTESLNNISGVINEYLGVDISKTEDLSTSIYDSIKSMLSDNESKIKTALESEYKEKYSNSENDNISKIELLSSENEKLLKRIKDNEETQRISGLRKIIESKLPTQFTVDSELISPIKENFIKSIIDGDEKIQELNGKVFVGSNDITDLISKSAFAKYVKTAGSDGVVINSNNDSALESKSLELIKQSAKNTQEAHDLIKGKILAENKNISAISPEFRKKFTEEIQKFNKL